MANQYLPGVNTIPNSLLILDITKSFPMVVTVVLFNWGAPDPRVNTYIAGMNVRFYVPITYGMIQANNRVGNILAVSGNNLAIDIDSSGFDTFTLPITTVEASASISPYGSKNLQYNNDNVRVVPFRSLNNIGN